MKVLVAGLVNCETNVAIDHFPLKYEPNRFLFDQTHTAVSGVGYNQAKALHVLGADVQFASLVGRDMIGMMIKMQLDRDGIDTTHICSVMEKTPQSVILYEKTGRRMANTDLQAIQDTRYPNDVDMRDVTYAIINNIMFAQSFLRVCKAHAIPIVTDLHTIESLDDAYHQAWFEAADILFLSDEKLVDPEHFVRELVSRYPKEIVVVGCGKNGALMYEKKTDRFYRQRAIEIGTITNTIGAGDALCSSFSYFYFSGKSAQEALRYASYFAAHKIQYSGGASGFISAREVEALLQTM